eukprot:TRINITY_DN6961_c0_g1_i2.p1 TRINITY_DN6961_c0_g1~~TRINITY_DN6961_c0_g1_i2.p1  ORF type:complete len:524 (+),score=107.94 TRINITY_DN6961_c0_g1_i2:58-1629(+)
MMRIVCPICGEEPQKGQRHFCKTSSQAPRQQVELQLAVTTSRPLSDGKIAGIDGGFASQRRAAPCASAGVMLASLSSLASKNPALWKSYRALTRCGGSDFMAALLCITTANPNWHRNPKQTLLCTLGRLADEAARALQDFWRCVRRSRSMKAPVRNAGTVDGYQQLVLTKAQAQVAPPPRKAVQAAEKRTVATGEPKARPPALMLAGPPTRPGQGSSGSAGSGGSGGSGSQAVPPSPRQPETPRNKSNPRPSQGRAVPLNPFLAMKQRKAQQQQEAEERRLQSLQLAEEARVARTQGGGSQPSSPQRSPQIAEALMQSPSPSASQEVLQPALPAAPAQVYKPAISAAPPSVNPVVPEGTASKPPLPPAEWQGPEAVLTPLERRQLRQASSNQAAMPSSPRAVLPETGPGAERPETPRASGAGGASPTAATERLRSRLRQRDAEGKTGEQRSSSRPATGKESTTANGGWKERIESRQKEAEEQQVMEQEEKQRTAERSSKRNDAMRRVMERQAQRQQDVVSLEA